MAVGIGIGSGVKRKAGGLGGALGGGNLTPTEQLRAAQSWYSSKSGGNQIIPSEVATPGGLAVLGASESTVTNDPTFLDHDGTDYVWFPGTASNYVSTPDSTELDMASGFRIEVDAQPDQWNGGSDEKMLVAKAGVSVSGWNYSLRIGLTGTLQVAAAIPTFGTIESTAAVSFADGERGHVAVEHDPDNGSNSVTTFYTSTDGETWTQLGSTVLGTSYTPVVNAEPLYLGQHIVSGGGDLWKGRLYRARVYDETDTLVLDVNMDVDADGSSSFACSTGQTATVNRSTSGLKTAVVTRPVYLFDGVDDRIELPSTDIPTITATTGKLTLVALARRHAGGVNDQLVHFSSASVNDTVALSISGADQAKAEFRANGGSYFVATQVAVPTDGSLFVVAAVFDAGTSYAYTNGNGLGSGLDYTSAGTINPMTFARVGERPGPADQYTGELFDALSFPGVALTEAELDVIAEKLIAGTYYPSDLPPRLLGAAQSWYSSKDGGTQVIEDRNDGLPATVGSVGAARIISDGLYLPGVAGNYASTPDAAALDITGDFDIRAHISNARPTIESNLMNKDDVGTNRSYGLELTDLGILRLRWSSDGAGTGELSRAASTAISTSSRYVRATLDVDDGASNHQVVFYESTDGSSWTQVGTTGVYAGVTSVFSGTAAMQVGQRANNSRAYNGIIYSLEIRNGIDGTVVASPNFAAQATDTTSFDDTQGNTWTVTGVTNTTNDPTFLDHTGEDYVWFPGSIGNLLTTPDADKYNLVGSTTRTLIFHMEIGSIAGLGTAVLASHTSAANGWRVQMWDSGTKIRFGNAAAAANSANHGMTAGEWWLKVEFNDTTYTVSTSTDGESYSSLAPVAHGATMADPLLDFHLGSINPSTAGPADLGIYDFTYSIDGATIVDLNFTRDTATASSIVAESGETWTIGRSTTGLKTAVVTRPVYVFDGTDDYLQLPAADTPTFTATTGKHTIVVAYRPHTVAGTNETIYSAEGAASDGLWIRRAASGIPTVRVGDGATNVNASAVVADTDSVFSVIAAVVDDGRATVYKHGVGLVNTEVFSALGTITHSAPRISSRAYSVTSFYSDEVFDVLSFPGTALTETELDVIAAKLIAGTYNAN